MQFTLKSRKTLKNIPSASGIEILGKDIYIMGDDSPWLFRLNNKFEVVEKFPIGDLGAEKGGKIPKQEKPDLEAMVAFGEDLLLFGSGSLSPKRDVLLRVNPTTHLVRKYSLLKFYDDLCAAAKFARKDLNIEAAAIIEEDLLLFNRGKNRIFRINIQALLTHAEGTGPVPAAKIFPVTLPALNGIEAGFSGATTGPDMKQIIFTASVENTPNWIDDGEILGSFVGCFPVSELKDSLVPGCVAITDAEKNILKIKVEAVTADKPISPNTFHLLLATDNDLSTSDLLEGVLEL